MVNSPQFSDRVRNGAFVRDRLGEESNPDLLEDESLLYQTLEQADIGIIHAKLDGRFVRVNSQFCQITGYDRPQLGDLDLYDLTHPNDRDALRDEIRQLVAREGSQSARVRQRCLRADGTSIWIDIKLFGAPTTDNPTNGTSSRALIGLVEAIRSRPSREPLSPEEFQSLPNARSLAEHAGEIVYRYRLAHPRGFEYISPSVAAIAGYTSAECEADPKLPLKQLHPDDKPLLKAWLRSQRDCFPLALRWFRKDGTLAWTELQNTRITDETGRCIAIEGIVRDVSERKQAELAIRHRTEREHLIGAIAQHIHQSLDLHEILPTAVTEIRQFLQTDRVFVFRFNPEIGNGEQSAPVPPHTSCSTHQPSKRGIVAVESVERPWRSMAGHRLSIPWTTSDLQNYQQGQIDTIADIQADLHAPWPKELMIRFQVSACLVVPIVVNKQLSLDPEDSAIGERAIRSEPRLMSAYCPSLWGLLVVHECRAPRGWTPVEIELLQTLTTQLAIAIQQSSLFERVQRQGIALERQFQARTNQLQQALEFEAMLKRITDKVRDSLDENQILQTAVRELTTVLGVSCCNAALYDLNRGTSTICYEYAASIPASQGRISQMGNFPEIYGQLQEGYYFQFCSLIPNPVRGRVAMLACPIFDNKGVLGDLWLIDRPDYTFNELELRLVQQVSNQCAIAIRQARLFQASQAQVAELEKLNRLKDDFLSTVSHELRTPVSNMKLAIHMLKLMPTDERSQRYLNILETECLRETELVNDLLDLQRLEAQSYPVSPETINPVEWVPNVIQSFSTRARNRQQNLRIDCPQDIPSLVSDRSNLERILVELLNNACKYTPTGGDVKLQVRHLDPSESIGFTVSNEAEIPPSELPRIFEKFYRVPHSDPWKQGGTGLGLALVQKLVEQLQGTIEVKSEGGWTQFIVQLPLHPDFGDRDD